MQGPLILDRYRPVEMSIKGGSGVVQVCWDTSLQRRVAIKRMPITNTVDGQIPGLAEARTGAMLKHPSIASVIDFAVQDGEAYLIMEAIEGVSLPDLIEQTPTGEMDLDIIAAVAQATSEALDFAHENQVLHLDIKPDNILVEMSGAIKVSDFGISELADAQGFGQALGGTIGYMPPEQICGEDLDQRCDLYSFAVVIYEMLTGVNPFLADTLDGSLKAMRRCAIALPSEVRDDIDPELDDVIMCALSPNRYDRYETVIDFENELMPYLGSPREGVRKLRTISEEGMDLDEIIASCETHDGLWDRFSDRTRTVAGHAVSAVLCWWVAALGVIGTGLLSTQLSMAAALVAAVIGAIAPGVGALLSMIVLAVGIGMSGAAPVWISAILIVVAIGWWIAAGRTETAGANCTLVTAPLGLIWFTPVAPLLAGFTLTFGRALVTGCMQAVLALCLGIATSSQSLLHFNLFLGGPASSLQWTEMMAQPAVWLTIGVWIVSAGLMSALCSRATRVSSIVGAFLGSALMFAGQAGTIWLATGSWGMPTTPWVLSIIGACAVLCIIGALGAPYRERRED